MKYYFIINPMAGKGKGIEKLKNAIARTAERLNKDYEIYITKSAGDGECYVNSICKTNNEPKALMAGGGGGTVNESVNGA